MKEINDMTVEERIELRSEKVKRVIGGIPPSLLHWSMALLTLISIALIVAANTIIYPYGEGETILEHVINN